jgi:hypothetical protein
MRDDNRIQPRYQKWDKSHNFRYLDTIEKKDQRRKSNLSVGRTASSASKTADTTKSDSHGRQTAKGIFEASIPSQRPITTAERKAFIETLAKDSAKLNGEQTKLGNSKNEMDTNRPLMSRRAYFNQLYKYKVMKQSKDNSIDPASQNMEDSFDEDDIVNKAQCNIWGVRSNVSERREIVHDILSSRLRKLKMNENNSIQKSERKKTVQFKNEDARNEIGGPGNSFWNKSLLQIVEEGLFGGDDISPDELLDHDFPFKEILLEDIDDCSAITLDAGLRLLSRGDL